MTGPCTSRGDRKVTWITAILLPAALMAPRLSASELLQQELIVVIGAPGTDDYASQFRTWAERWTAAARNGGADCVVIGDDDGSPDSDRDRLKREIDQRASASDEPLWLIVIGHGTWDGKTARINLRGPDVAAQELSEWLKPVSRPLAVINCTSCSGPFLPELSGRNRVVITATRSGNEYNFARLGGALSEAIADPAADLDKDEQTSLLEAWLLATARVREFYSNETRLLTEHSLLDDNGDRRGTPADWFQGIKAIKSANEGAALDGALATRFVLVRGGADAGLSPEARAERDRLEEQLREVRQLKGELPEAEYLLRLEAVLLQLAELYGESPPE